MDHIPGHVLRTLWYIDLLAEQGQPLSPESIDAFARRVPPRDAKRDSVFLEVAWMFGETGRVVRRPEPVADYLKGVGWIEPFNGGMRLTKIGRAVLIASGEEAAQLDASDPEVADVALDPQDPLVYVQLTRRLQKAGEGLLVDAYFMAESLVWLIESTNLRRVLISSRHRSAERDRQTIAVALATVPNGSDVEVRHTKDPSLHDRCVVSASGDVQLLGSSVSGVGKHLTAVITPSSDIAAVYRKKYEDLWQSADTVEPQPVKA
ncbi:hypothetical protein [Streptomyces sp. Root369]|uniref:hypothetical protein n=1 Tax=Streptomyces sp. Root369 TaxID=1736523 RepID=UPI000AA21739|nr:hypothetical protein [Streptomyces sp. Root369]